MMRTEKICLKWEDFQENVTSVFRTLKESADFVDVTLVSEDGQHVKAHKVILASTSPFFMNLLGKSSHPQPLIYMRGVLYEDLVGLVDFVYSGETSILQENLNRFLALAQELQLKGLSGKDGEEEREEMQRKGRNSRLPVVKKESPKVDMVQEDHVVPDQNEAADENGGVFVDIEHLDEKLNSMIGCSENRLSESYGKIRARVCKVCGKEGSKTNIRQPQYIILTINNDSLSIVF